MSKTDEILNDIRMYLRIAAAKSLKTVAPDTIDSYEKALVYSKMSGTTTQEKIKLDTGVPQRTISAWANAFVEAGLASPPNEYYQNHRALFTLWELGINLSGLKKRKSRKSRKTGDADEQK